MITCPSCSHPNTPGSAFCDNCGHDLRNVAPAPAGAPASPPMPQAGGGAICPSGQFSNVAGAAFCENCGSPLGAAPPVQTPVAQPPVTPTPPPPAAPAGGQNCSSCGYQNLPGATFCENCGNQMGQAAPPAPIPVPAPPPQVVTPPAGGQPCSSCGHPNPPGTAYCENCGMAMGQAQAPVVQPPVQPIQPPVQQQPPYQPPPPPTFVTGCLVVQASGASIPIPPGKSEIFIGREDPVSGIFPEIDLDPHGGHDGGMGRKHARLYMQGSQLMLEDLNSVNGTLLNKQKVSPEQPQPVTDGAELRFGKVVTTYNAS